MPMKFTLSGKPYHQTIALNTTPRTLRDIIGNNKLPKGRICLGAELLEPSGDLLWGEEETTCDIPFAAADAPWDKPFGAAALDLYFAAAAGSQTAIALIYFG